METYTPTTIGAAAQRLRAAASEVQGRAQATDREVYLATMTPMRAGKARKALEWQIRLDGVFLWRWQAAETIARRPGCRVDYAKGRVLHGNNGHFYTIADLSLTAADYISWLTAKA